MPNTNAARLAAMLLKMDSATIVLVELDVAAPVRKRRHDIDAARFPAR
jgi:hypothetical protein